MIGVLGIVRLRLVETLSRRQQQAIQPGCQAGPTVQLRHGDRHSTLRRGSGQAPAPEAPSAPGPTPGAKVEVTITVPQLDGGPGLAPGLDGLLLAAAQRFRPAAAGRSQYTYHADYSVPYDADTLLSVVFDITVDHGGVHGQGVQVAVNYAPTLRRAIEADDLVDDKGVARPDQPLPGASLRRGKDPPRRRRRCVRRRPDRKGGGGTASGRSNRGQFHRDGVRDPLRRLCRRLLCRGGYRLHHALAVLRKAAKPGAPLPKG